MTPDKAQALISEAVPRWGPESVAISAAAGCILREDINAERDQPPFDRVTMDGIAISSAAISNGQRNFVIAGAQGAGAPPMRLQQVGECIEVMTGAVLPEGADCVVPFEQLEILAGAGASASGVGARGVAQLRDDVEAAFESGANIHRRATDAHGGAVLLAKGRRLTPSDIAVAASAGQARLAVSRAPRIMVISTGDELIEPGDPIEPWQIRRSNIYAVVAALTRHGWTQNFQDHLPDDLETLKSRLATHLDTHDVLVLSGGVSKGRFDHVPAALEALGVQALVHGVAQRPGKPLWFGLARSGKPVFALPGNPVSTLACLARYVLPALQIACGATDGLAPAVSLAEPFHSTTRFAALVPCSLEVGPDAVCRATLAATSTSGDLVSLRGTEGYVELPPGPGVFHTGLIVPFYRC